MSLFGGWVDLLRGEGSTCKALRTAMYKRYINSIIIIIIINCLGGVVGGGGVCMCGTKERVSRF